MILTPSASIPKICQAPMMWSFLTPMMTPVPRVSSVRKMEPCPSRRYAKNSRMENIGTTLAIPVLPILSTIRTAGQTLLVPGTKLLAPVRKPVTVLHLLEPSFHGNVWVTPKKSDTILPATIPETMLMGGLPAKTFPLLIL